MPKIILINYYTLAFASNFNKNEKYFKIIS